MGHERVYMYFVKNLGNIFDIFGSLSGSLSNFLSFHFKGTSPQEKIYKTEHFRAGKQSILDSQ